MRKSFVLVLVVSLLMLCLVIFSFYFFALRSHIERTDAAIDKTISYYLLESALTGAIRFYYEKGISQGSIDIKVPFRTGTHRWGDYVHNWDFAYQDFSIPQKVYSVNYRVSTPMGERHVGEGFEQFDLWVDSPRGFKNRTYHLTASIRRTFPLFIRGMPGK